MTGAVAVVASSTPAVSTLRPKRVRAEYPVVHVDKMDVLFDQDVSGQHAVVNPIAQPALAGAGVREVARGDRTGIVVRQSAHDGPDVPFPDPLGRLDVRRCVPELK